MNKKILLSLSVIAAVATIAVGGTIAYFSDTETSTGNTFTAGTIDISVDGENPWTSTEKYQLNDMKPSQIEYTNFTIENTGTNPANVWKKVTNVKTEENGINESECEAYGGSWNGASCTGGTAKNDLDQVIQYDLSVIVKDSGGTERWSQTLYNMDKTIADIVAMPGYGTFLGMVPAGWTMDVTESYHMDASADNNYQSDKMTFDISLTAEQLKGTLVLEDKEDSEIWRVKGETTSQVIITYGVKDATLKITDITGQTVVAGDHSLITYPESYSNPSGSSYPNTDGVF